MPTRIRRAYIALIQSINLFISAIQPGRYHFYNDSEKFTDKELKKIVFALLVAIIIEMIAVALFILNIRRNG